MPLHSIYALCEPGTLTARYVGRTRHSIAKRVKHHVAKARVFSYPPVYAWINSLGEAPNVVLLATCPGEVVRDVERAWILLFIDNGYDMLNIRDCDGRGAKHKQRYDPCSDPVYFRNLIDRLIAEEDALNGDDQDAQQ